MSLADSNSLPWADLAGQMVVLGTGTSVGVPVIGCACATCTSENPRNQRTRCALAVGLPEGLLLVDTPPDLRFQLLRERIRVAQAVLYTHEHADHLFGLDDLRLFPFYLGHPVPLYCEAKVEARIRKSFDYAFQSEASTHKGATPQLVFHTISDQPFELLGEIVTPIPLQHGPRFTTLGFRFGNVAYCTDASAIPPSSMQLLEGLDVLIIDALRPEPHITHLSLGEAVAIAETLQPKRTYFTHTSHELEYDATNAALPEGMELAYDGLRIPLT